MNKGERNFQIASWTLVGLGTTHLVTHLGMILSREVEPPIIGEMRKFSPPIPGAKTDLATMHVGFSVAMGVGMIGFGALNLLVLKKFGSGYSSTPTIRYFNAGFTGTLFLISCKYFFYAPIILSGISTIFFLLK